MMNSRLISVLAGFLLFLPLLLGGAQAAEMTPAPNPVFKPATETRKDLLFQEQQQTAGEVFGGRSGYVHPFLSVGGYYTNNLFNTANNKEHDNVLLVSPGLWLALPASRQQLLDIETLNTAVGGLEVSRFRNEEQRRFQGYALYRGTFSKHERFKSADTDDHRAEALFSYNAPGGLSIELLDIFQKDHDPFATGASRSRLLDEYKSNLLSPSLGFRVGPRLMLRADFDWYVLNYSAVRNNYRDREDQVVSTYIFYRLTPKTSTFVNYVHASVNYDKSDRFDNGENRYFAGIQWKVTDKSRGRIKLGYGKRNYSGPEKGRTFFAVEARIDHRLTRKTRVFLQASRKVGQTDVQGSRDVLNQRVRVGYVQDFAAKLSGKLNAFYYRKAYSGNITIGSETHSRTDNKYGGEVALGYTPVRWLNFSTGYLYTERNSDFNIYDYKSHTVYLNLTAAL